eukprot:CAMPEP_0119502856 /NCGR_PEP_ID=MMETSP1344-20130328/24197_1 /TAXON_ID=236787 /ORGANISM="Florenciella parvula, Strain CCMP2471" /LENGTH=80 /DNA_ID=CAMNT_0007539095 /DNA_START=182 /DNA_END=425 /DNA_ORIENTATION=+
MGAPSGPVLLALAQSALLLLILVLGGSLSEKHLDLREALSLGLNATPVDNDGVDGAEGREAPEHPSFGEEVNRVTPELSL